MVIALSPAQKTGLSALANGRAIDPDAGWIVWPTDQNGPTKIGW
jgi:hypothetical protein